VADSATLAQYRLDAPLAEGILGPLYRARDLTTGEDVALRLLEAPVFADARLRARVRRDVGRAVALVGPGIARTYGWIETRGRHAVASELVRGAPLRDRLADLRAMEWLDWLPLIEEVLLAVQNAHEQGVIHGGLGAGAIWIGEDGRPRVTGFGLWRARAAVAQAARGPAYFAPEQTAGQPVDGRADVFAIGVLLRDLVHRSGPMPSGPAGRLLADTLARTLAAEPGDRVGSALELALALRRIRATTAAIAVRSAPAGGPARGAAGVQAVAPRAPEAGAAARTDVPAAGEPARIDEGGAGAAPPSAANVDLVFRDVPAAAPPEESPGAVAAGPAGRPWWYSRSLVAGVSAAVILLAAVTAAWLWVGRQDTSMPATASAARSIEPAAGAAAGRAQDVGSPAATGAGEGQQLARTPPSPAGEPGGQTAATRSVTVASEPPGADVTVSGRRVGLVTPARIDVPAGATLPLEITLTRRGHLPVTLHLSEDQIAKGQVSATLPPEPPPVVVVLTASYEFEVLDGSRVLSSAASRSELTLPAGRRIRVRAPDVFLDLPLTVAAGESGTMQVPLPELGTLTVRSPLETCRVSIRGEDLGYPPVNNLRVAAGTYAVELACAGGERRREVVTVPAGESVLAVIR
jgi:serine/threonine-protein kinase